MARSRNIKPGFFTNEVLGEMSPLARILFAGMWCHADREGRLEDRLKRLKPQVLPYDECDIDALAQCLHDAKLVHRYIVDGKGYIQVLEFKKHQNPHVKEQASTIPAPCKHQTSTVVARLIPDSLNPITDSGCPDSLVPSKTKAKPRKNGHDVEPLQLPEWIPLDQWQAWIEARTKKRNAPTQWAMKLAVIKLEHLRKDGHSVARILADSAFNGWAGLFPPKD